MKENDIWKDYSERTANAPPKARLINLLEKIMPAPGTALDVGSGGGRDSKLLLAHGWRVDAFDGNREALKIAATSCDFNPRLKTIHANFNDVSFLPTKYDLINAGYSLPFCSKETFPYFWQNLTASVKRGGYISCDFFGERDEWNQNARSDMTFLTKENALSLFEGWDILHWTEEEKEAPTAMGAPKHWHIFTCTARKK